MKKCFLIILSMFCLIFLNISYAEENHNSKKIVSIVYDDSGSMLAYNNYCYSDYALQILTASLGENDELNIVKVSNPDSNIVVDLSTPTKKQNYINEIRGYQHTGGTFFESVTSAKDWLISRKDIYQEGADYWLVVITDGDFMGMPSDLNSYFSELNQQFNNMNYEFVLLNIGEAFDRTLEEAVNSSANSSTIKANDNQSIYNSLLNISNMINRGASDKLVKVTQINSTTLHLQVDLPLEKMMLLMQNTETKVNKITNTSTGSSMSIENYDVRYDGVSGLKSNIAQIRDDNTGFINRGSYDLEFDKEISISNISFLCEAYVSARISIVDENDKVLNDSQIKFLTSDKRVKIKCELLDGSGLYKLDLSNMGVDFSNITIQLVNDKNKYNMTYDTDKKAYYTELTLIGKNNNIYAIAEARDVFRIKSNVIFVDTVANQMNIEKYNAEKIIIEVPYTSSKEYQEVSGFRFSFQTTVDDYNTAENFEIKLIDLPKGIKIKYEDKEYGDGDSVPMIKELGKNYDMRILANKDYKETGDVTSTFKIINLTSYSEIYWDNNGSDEAYVTFTPKLYKIDMVRTNPNPSIDINNDKIHLSIIKIDEESNAIIGNVGTSDVGKISTNSSFGTGYTYSVKKSDSTLDIQFKPNILALFKSNKVPVEITVDILNGREIATYKEEIELLNVDYFAILRPYIIGLILLIIAFGYISKKKFNKKSQIAITENGDRVLYTLRPQTATLLIPYKAHKAKIGLIEFKAGKHNELIYSAKGLDILKLDGENFEEYKETNRINLEKMIMKRDFSSIVINAFDVEQKYEYITKEPDMGSYSSGSDSDFSSDMDSSFSSDDSYMDTYSDDNLY